MLQLVAALLVLVVGLLNLARLMSRAGIGWTWLYRRAMLAGPVEGQVTATEDDDVLNGIGHVEAPPAQVHGFGRVMKHNVAWPVPTPSGAPLHEFKQEIAQLRRDHARAERDLKAEIEAGNHEAESRVRRQIEDQQRRIDELERKLDTPPQNLDWIIAWMIVGAAVLGLIVALTS